MICWLGAFLAAVRRDIYREHLVAENFKLGSSDRVVALNYGRDVSWDYACRCQERTAGRIVFFQLAYIRIYGFKINLNELHFPSMNLISVSCRI